MVSEMSEECATWNIFRKGVGGKGPFQLGRLGVRLEKITFKYIDIEAWKTFDQAYKLA